MHTITDPEVRNLGDQKSITESMGRGRGAMVIKRQVGTTTGYYRYWKGNQSVFIKIGIYKEASKTVGLTLAQLRDKALELATTRQRISPVDLKSYLADREADRQREENIKRIQIERDASRGTLEDLINAYHLNLCRKEASSAKNVKTTLATNVIKAFPNLAKRKAADITPDDIMDILRKVLERGNTTNYNRIRSYLMAAFNLGMKADHDVRQQIHHGKRFYIDHNPVTPIPKYTDYEVVRKRQLSNAEIQQLWVNIHQGAPGWNILYSHLIRFLFACYGNRPKQLSRCLWSDIDFSARTLTFIDSKGKAAKPKKRIIPLTDRAIRILDQAREVSGDNPGPFYIGKNVAIDVRNLARYVENYNVWLENQSNTVIERFTAKDIRRTCTRLFTDCRVPAEQRFLLQSRESGTIESKHYDHDDRLSEKRDYAVIYDNYLEKIITGSLSEKVVEFDRFRRLGKK